MRGFKSFIVPKEPKPLAANIKGAVKTAKQSNLVVDGNVMLDGKPCWFAFKVGKSMEINAGYPLHVPSQLREALREKGFKFI